MMVSVVCTLKNEEESIGEFIDSLLTQTRRPDEIIITDGGSTDGTVGILEQYAEKGCPIKVEVIPGANRSRGRNRAIELASGEIIAVTDAGCKLDARWLECITAPFVEHAGTTAVAGFYQPSPKGYREICIGAMTIPDIISVDPNTFLPSSRSVAFLKSAWEDAGRYPEHLSHNEDTPFDIALIKAGHRFYFEPEALVYWRPRGDAYQVYRQFRAYARGDGQARIFGRTYRGIYIRYAILIAAVTIAIATADWLFLLLGIIAVSPRILRDLYKVNRKIGGVKDISFSAYIMAMLYVIPVRSAIDYGDMTGYLRGLYESRQFLERCIP